MQVPANFNAPSHTLLREMAAKSPRAGELLERLPAGDAVGEPAAYVALLAGLGCEVDAWETTYQHVLNTGADQADDDCGRFWVFPPCLAGLCVRSRLSGRRSAPQPESVQSERRSVCN